MQNQMTINAEGVLANINKPFLPIMKNHDRYLVVYGGAGSGKSVAVAQKIVIRILKAMKRGEKHTFLCLRKTQPAASKSIYPLIMDIIEKWNLRKLVKVNKTNLTITFPGGSTIMITGMDDPEKIKSIHGLTGVWLEESTEFSYDDFQQIDLRLRGETWDYKQIVLTFNPIDESHWIRKLIFTDQLQADIEGGQSEVRKEYSQEIGDGKKVVYAMTIMHSTYKDNRFLDDIYKARLLQLVNEDSNYYEIYCRGRWGVLRGLIFDNWDTCEDIPDDVSLRGFGMDFGFSADPSAIVEIGVGDKDLYLKEHFYKSGMTNQQLAQILIPITAGRLHYPIVADSAEPKSIVEIRTCGIPCIPAGKGKDSVVYGIQKMKQYKIHICEDSINLIKEIRGYKWAEDKNGNQLNAPVKYNDHLIDASRYILTKLRGGVPVGVTFSEDNADVLFRKNQIKVTDPDHDDDESMWNEI